MIDIHNEKTEAIVITCRWFIGPMKRPKIVEGNIKFLQLSECLGAHIDNELS